MKKRIILIVSIIVVLIGIIFGILFLTGFFKEDKEKKFISMTKEFYGYYYDENNKDKKVKDFLKNYKDSGLKISLGNVEVYLDGKHGTEGNYKVFSKCDVDKSFATIYPIDPYGKKDVKISVELECK